MAKKTINDLREELFDTIKMLKNKQMDLETAKTVVLIVHEICNVTKLELEFVKIAGGLGTGFIPDEEDEHCVRLTVSRSTNKGNQNKINADMRLVRDFPQSKDIKITAIQKDIIEFLIENGGENRIGIIANTRFETIQNLEILEKKGILRCVERPTKLEFSSTRYSEDDANYCGIWKLQLSVQLTE